MTGTLYFEDGTIFIGKGFGKIGTSVGELVFNTSMTGYQEILTDPSYAGQIITMTYPLIGNYGVNTVEQESRKIFAKGLIVKSFVSAPSNYMSENTLDEFLKFKGIVGIYDVDTRSITKKVRSHGSLKCVISTEDLSIPKLEAVLKASSLETNFMEEVSLKEPTVMEGSGAKIVLLDFGAKASIIHNLRQRNCHITILPYTTTYEEILSLHPDGVLLSNGPGDPKMVEYSIHTVKKTITKFPTFGICLGHQILALALGADTFKMKFGHHGGNHGVYDIEKDRCFITSQNHNYAVTMDSLKDKDIEITHFNLNDHTIEGIQHKKMPVFSVQFHPEGAPGPSDTTYLFDKFMSVL